MERESTVERLLRLDPAGVYDGMSPGSRAHYRQVVETLAQRGAIAEEEVARATLKLANKAGVFQALDGESATLLPTAAVELSEGANPKPRRLLPGR